LDTISDMLNIFMHLKEFGSTGLLKSVFIRFCVTYGLKIWGFDKNSHFEIIDCTF